MHHPAPKVLLPVRLPSAALSDESALSEPQSDAAESAGVVAASDSEGDRSQDEYEVERILLSRYDAISGDHR
jgi:hypothetical protein